MESHLVYIKKPWGFRKVLWVLLLLGGIGLTTHDTYKAVARFFAKPTNTFMTLKYPEDLAFPQLIICNSNQYRITETEKDLYPLITAAYENEKIENFYIDNFTDLIESTMNRTGFREAYVYRQRVAHKLSDMMLKCLTWTGENCTESFVEKMYDYGVCYNLNGSAMDKITQGGSSQALTLYLNLESYQHMQGPAEYLNSLKVALLHRDVFPYMTAKAFDVPPGFMTVVSLKYYKNMRVLSKDGGTCAPKVELEHFDEHHYSYDTCQLNLALVETQKICGCKPFYATEKSFQASRSSQKCNQTCETVEYDPTLSASKIPSSVWPSVISPYAAQRIYDTFNRSMESWSRHDRTRAQRLRALTDSLQAAMNELARLGMEPPQGDRLAKDGLRRSFEKAAAPACYTEVLSKYGDIFEELDERGGGGGPPFFGGMDRNCGQDRQDPNRPPPPRDDSLSAYMNRLINDDGDLWDFLHLHEYFDQPSDLNTSHAIFREQACQVARYIKDLAWYYRTPISLQKPVSLATYWSLADDIEAFNNRSLWLKDWVDTYPDGIGVEYQSSYASEFIYIYQSTKSRMDKTSEGNSNISQVVVDPKFWAYFSIYLFFKERVYNESLCKNLTSTNDLLHFLDSCAQNPFFKFQPFLADMLQCASGDYSNQLKVMHQQSVNAAATYRQSADNLEDFLMSYGRRWEFGDDFFADNIVGLKIFFADLSQHYIVEEMAYNASNLFGDIGGSLGLFIGASVLSLFEFFDTVLCDMFLARKFKNLFREGTFSIEMAEADREKNSHHNR